MRELSIPESVADVIRLLYLKGLVQVRGGNASVLDRNKGLVYISPSGLPRHLIEADDVAIIDLDGAVKRGIPSSEWRMHVEIYKNIADSVAVVHAHSPWTITLGELDVNEIPIDLTTEAKARVRCVTLVPRIEPGTWELAREVSKRLRAEGCNAAILRGHGVVAYSTKSIYHALEIVEAVEDLAKIYVLLRLLGLTR